MENAASGVLWGMQLSQFLAAPCPADPGAQELVGVQVPRRLLSLVNSLLALVPSVAPQMPAPALSGGAWTPTSRPRHDEHTEGRG